MAIWTRKRTFDPELDDWVILRDVLMVGRVVRDEPETSGVATDQWMWSVITMPAWNGWATSMDEALERVRDLASDNWGHEPHGWPADR